MLGMTYWTIEYDTNHPEKKEKEEVNDKKYVSRKEVAAMDDIYKEMLAMEKHDHKIIMDDHGTLRWEADPVIDMVSPGGEYACLDLNQLFRNGARKNDPRIRELYRRMGYSLFGYWEVFYWEANNPQADEYKEDE